MVGCEGEGIQPDVAAALLDGARQHASHHLVHLRAGAQQQPPLEAPGRNEVAAFLLEHLEHPQQPIPSPSLRAARSMHHASHTRVL